MNRGEIRERFREENPEITANVVADSVLNSWLIQGNLEMACESRIITAPDNSITAEVGEASYDLLTYIVNFYDIDENPGGGIAFNNKRLRQTTKAELDNKASYWRTRTSGTPKKYFITNTTITFDYPPSVANEILVDVILKPDDLDDDAKIPFNGYTHLEPFHYGLVAYLQGRAKMKIGKDKDKANAMREYEYYVKWTKKQIQGIKFGTIRFIKPTTFISRYSGQGYSR